MLRQLDNNLWVAEQPLKFMGLPVGTRMTVIRLADNSLLLISPIEITPKIKQQLISLGTVKYLIAPNLFHHLYFTLLTCCVIIGGNLIKNIIWVTVFAAAAICVIVHGC